MGPFKKKIMVFVGFVSIFLGVVGIFLPLLPTTPFILLSGYLFSKSSTKFHNWLLNHKYLGIYIRNYTEKKGVPLKAKCLTISVLWITIMISALIFTQFVWVKVLLLIVAVTVTIHLIVIPIYKENEEI